MSTDVIVVDSPRAGCDKAILENFAHMTPKRIVYVSCNLTSLAKAIAILTEFVYVAKEIRSVDMFSETSHIKCIALLEKK